MSEDKPEFDSKILIPFLKTINEAGKDGLAPEETGELWEDLMDGTGYSEASKVRQSMYITKTAYKNKVTGRLHLTAAGMELIANGAG